jgi:hypothetical protein
MELFILDDIKQMWKTSNVLFKGVRNMNQRFLLLDYVLTRFETLWDHEWHGKDFFSIRMLMNLKRCYLQIENLEKLVWY